LIAGFAELAIGLWIVTSLHASITTLLISVAAGTVVHGIGDIRSAFLVRKIGHTLPRGAHSRIPADRFQRRLFAAGFTRRSTGRGVSGIAGGGCNLYRGSLPG
jgi:hypothetical protein